VAGAFLFQQLVKHHLAVRQNLFPGISPLRGSFLDLHF
jgi:hypothetical protein